MRCPTCAAEIDARDREAALRPITALTDDFHTPAHVALTFGFGALILLVGLLWRGAHWRLLLRPSGTDRRE